MDLDDLGDLTIGDAIKEYVPKAKSVAVFSVLGRFVFALKGMKAPNDPKKPTPEEKRVYTEEYQRQIIESLHTHSHSVVIYQSGRPNHKHTNCLIVDCYKRSVYVFDSLASYSTQLGRQKLTKFSGQDKHLVANLVERGFDIVVNPIVFQRQGRTCGAWVIYAAVTYIERGIYMHDCVPRPTFDSMRAFFETQPQACNMFKLAV
jgi:ribosomal protein L18